jgi:hypothetical protein
MYDNPHHEFPGFPHRVTEGSASRLRVLPERRFGKVDSRVGRDHRKQDDVRHSWWTSWTAGMSRKGHQKGEKRIPVSRLCEFFPGLRSKTAEAEGEPNCQ